MVQRLQFKTFLAVSLCGRHKISLIRLITKDSLPLGVRLAVCIGSYSAKKRLESYADIIVGSTGILLSVKS